MANISLEQVFPNWQQVLKHKGNDEYQGACPHCGGTDRLHVQPERQRWGCRQNGDYIGGETWLGLYMHLTGVKDVSTALTQLGVSNDNGNNQKTIDKSGLEKVPNSAPLKTAQAKPKRKTFTSGQEYAEWQGVPWNIFKNWGCEQIVYGKRGNAIAFPSADGIRRLRFLDDNDPKWKPETDRDDDNPVSPQWFGVSEAIETARSEGIGKHLVMCNGQTSVIVANHFGVPAFCKTDGEGKPIPEKILPKLLEYLRAGYQLYIALDNDETGQTWTRKLFTQLMSLPEELPLKPKIITWDNTEVGYDLANHCRQYKDNSWKELLKLATNGQVELPAERLQSLELAVREMQKTIANGKSDQLLATLTKTQKMIDSLMLLGAPALELSTGDIINNAYKAANEAMNQPRLMIGLSCGLKELDHLLGGMEESSLHTLMGLTGSGKTTFMAGCVCQFLRQAPGIVWLGETTPLWFITKMIAYLTKIPAKTIYRGGWIDQKTGKFIHLTEDEKGRIHDYYQKLRDKKDKLKFLPAGIIVPNVLTEMVKRYKNECGAQWLILDSLHEIKHPGHGSEYEAVSDAAITAENIAVSNELLVLATVQAGRNIKNRANKRLGLNDPVGSGRVEEKSAYVYSIYDHNKLIRNGELTEADRDENRYPQGTVILDLLKTRNDNNSTPIILDYIGGTGFYNHEIRGK